MNFDKYYDPQATDREVLREVYKGLRPEVRRGRAHRQTRHALYLQVIMNRANMAQVLGWSTTH
jgi:hypothetical protein